MVQLVTQSTLTDARKAYHDLMVGRSARVLVDQNGERVEFTAARKVDLYNYIKELESTLGYPLNGPATFTF